MRINRVCMVFYGICRKLSAVDARAFQVPIALCSLSFGMILSMSPHLLEAPAYRMLGAAAPAWAWSMVMVATGAILLVGWYCASKRVARVGLALSTALLTFVACLFFFTGGVPTGFTTYALLAAMSGWALVKLSNGLL